MKKNIIYIIICFILIIFSFVYFSKTLCLISTDNVRAFSKHDRDKPTSTYYFDGHEWTEMCVGDYTRTGRTLLPDIPKGINLKLKKFLVKASLDTLLLNGKTAPHPDKTIQGCVSFIDDFYNHESNNKIPIFLPVINYFADSADFIR